MNLKPWNVLVEHDDGQIRIRVYTSTKQAAIESVMSYEHCPRSAILSVTPGKD